MATGDSKQRPPRVKDLSGKRCGFQVVIDFAEMRGNTPNWNVRCDCGFVRPVSGHNLTNGRSTRCRINCPASTSRIDETGNVHGKLTVRKYVGTTKSGDCLWLCDCDCGNQTIVARGDLLKKCGATKSCGCLRSSAGGGHKTPEYTSWKEMKRRCYNPNNDQYHLYGGRAEGRAITVCDRWRKSFVNFLADMGPKPFPEASVERINNDGNYSCGHCDECNPNGWSANCKWATKLEQGQNTRNGFYELLKKYSFRLFLRDVIKQQDFFRLENVTRYATSEVTKDYLEYLRKIGLVEKVHDGFRLSLRPIKSFGETLECFISETFKVEFAAEAIWGIKFKRPRVGGDYDLIAKVDGAILYMEIKSSPPKQIYQRELTAFFDRLSDLLPEIGIFFVDTELRMKDKIVPMFEEELDMRYVHPPKIMRVEKELFQIEDKIFIMNAKDSIATNIEKVLRRYFRKSR